MIDEVEHQLDIERDRLAHLETKQLPLLTGAEQTRLSWARKIESRDALPRVYHDFFDALLTGGRAFPHTVVTPTFAGFMNRETEKLIFSLDQCLYVIARERSGLQTTCYALTDIHCVEAGSILLHSWLTIHGTTREGAGAASTLRFNTVTDRLFEPFIQQLRPSRLPRAGVDLEAEQCKFDYLTTVNFKFKNYARRSILPGETVICPVLQPEIRAKIVALFGRSWSRTVSTAHIHILTDAEWIIIRDDEHSPLGNGGVRYGGVWDYIPLNKIKGVTLTARGDERLALTIHLPGDDHVDAIFAGSNRLEINSFLDRYQSLAPDVTVQRALR